MRPANGEHIPQDVPYHAARGINVGGCLVYPPPGCDVDELTRAIESVTLATSAGAAPIPSLAGTAAMVQYASGHVGDIATVLDTLPLDPHRDREEVEFLMCMHVQQLADWLPKLKEVVPASALPGVVRQIMKKHNAEVVKSCTEDTIKFNAEARKLGRQVKVVQMRLHRDAHATNDARQLFSLLERCLGHV